jgi:ABC-2 type transport system permease protein
MTTVAPAGSAAGRALTLAATEVRLLVRNRTTAISSLFLPVAFGAFFAWSFDPAGGNALWGTVVALQLVMTFAMAVYMTLTQTVVARRQARVLKRMRTSGLSDGGLLAAVSGPVVGVALVHLVIYAAVDVLLGVPVPDPLPLLLAAVGGLAVCIAAAFATTVVTPTAERAQYTTLPLFFTMFAAAFVLPLLPVDSPLQALVLVPGAPIGQLAQLAFTGGAWAPGLLGLPAILWGVVSLALWAAVFAVAARRSFRWDPRH